MLVLLAAILAVNLYWGCNETYILPEGYTKTKINPSEQKLTQQELQKNKQEMAELKEQIEELKKQQASPKN
jgi:cell division protein FtsB